MSATTKLQFTLTSPGTDLEEVELDSEEMESESEEEE